jgi:hypothetical protein
LFISQGCFWPGFGGLKFGSDALRSGGLPLVYEVSYLGSASKVFTPFESAAVL